VQKTSQIAFAFVVASLAVLAQSASACVDYVVRSGSKEAVMVVEEPNARPVTWSDSIAAAQRIAAQKQQPFVVYFCSQDLADVAGGDAKAFAEYRRTHSGDAPDWTVFDCPRMTAEMNKVGIGAYAKVADTPENAKLFARYGAKPGMLIVCTPEGDKFAACDSSRDAVLDTLYSLHERYEDWVDGARDNVVASNDLESRFR
jgi:hypothetical protein